MRKGFCALGVNRAHLDFGSVFGKLFSLLHIPLPDVVVKAALQMAGSVSPFARCCWRAQFRLVPAKGN
jgi:hypothetical protein